MQHRRIKEALRIQRASHSWIRISLLANNSRTWTIVTTQIIRMSEVPDTQAPIRPTRRIFLEAIQEAWQACRNGRLSFSRDSSRITCLWDCKARGTWSQGTAPTFSTRWTTFSSRAWVAAPGCPRRRKKLSRRKYEGSEARTCRTRRHLLRTKIMSLV